MSQDGCNILEPADVMHRRPEVKSLEDLGQGVEPDHLSGALGHYGTEWLQTWQRSVALQSESEGHHQTQY